MFEYEIKDNLETKRGKKAFSDNQERAYDDLVERMMACKDFFVCAE